MTGNDQNEWKFPNPSEPLEQSVVEAIQVKMDNPKQDSDKCISSHDKAVLNRLFNPELPYSDVPDEEPVEPVDNEEQTEEVLESKRLEKEGVNAAESGDIITALELFSQAIQVAPNRASGYNNRAQALRLKGDVQGALQDLNKAIEISNSQGKSACQAHTQRGLIRRLEGDDDGALNDFKIAANMGSELAKHMVVQLNPYAALCNQMLSEVIGKIRRGEA